jgi:hypothetical protein
LQSAQRAIALIPSFLILPRIYVGCFRKGICPRAISRQGFPRRRGGMKMLTDCFGQLVRLTDERLAHILEHPEMKAMEREIEQTLQAPQLVRCSRSDETVRLFYEFYVQTIVDGKWLCVVVKYAENDAFVITAYLTDKPKAGDDLWPKK